jgi:hypothetical protein
VKNETMGDKTLRGEKKFSVCLEDEKRKTIGAKNRKIKKTESRIMISQHIK